MRRLCTLLAAVALAVTGLVVPSAAAQASVDPQPRPIRYAPIGEDSSFPAAFGATLVDADRTPLGANNWHCTPTAAHPYPVVLVHGTWENAYDNWNGLAPILAAAGYCVYALNYGNSTGIRWMNGTGDMIDSAHQLAPFVDRVRAATGAAKVDLVGHSQGGALIRYYTNLLGGARHVDQVVAITPSNHPTTLDGITELGRTLGLLDPALQLLTLIKMPAAAQQAATDPPSPFYQQLNGHGETVPGIGYTVIGTRNDEVVTPYTQSFVTAGPGAAVHNITLQDVCGIDQSDHLSAPYSKNVAQIVLNALDPGDQHAVRCYPQAPLTGNTQRI